MDYSHLDIIAEVERITGRRLVRHTRTSSKYHCACPFPDCTSKNDAFTVWDRSQLEERGNGRRETHFWCGRCGRAGSLISLLRQYREATTSEQISWSEAARELHIDPQTWHAMDRGGQSALNPAQRTTSSEKRRQKSIQQRATEQAECATLDALYRRAQTWLSTGRVSMKDGQTTTLNQMQAYLQARGCTLEQAMQLGLAYIPTVQEVPALANLIGRNWRGRILFPLTGPHGASGYAGRTLWRWTPGMTAEQHKRLLDAWNEQHPDQRILRHYKTHQPAYYGYEEACRASTLVMLEGEFDAASVRLALWGRPDIAVCAFGIHIQARLVPLNVLHVVLALDSDQAGQEATVRLVESLHGRGITVSVALPPTGKDWNECHQLVGRQAIRAEILRACAGSQMDGPEQQEVLPQGEIGAMTLASASEIRMVSEALPSQPAEPPGYEQGEMCLVCGQQLEHSKGALFACEDQVSSFYGDIFCTFCWQRQQTPLHIEQINAVGQVVTDLSRHREHAPEPVSQQAQRDQKQAAFFALVHRVRADWPEPHTIVEEEQKKCDEPGSKSARQDDLVMEESPLCPRHHRLWRYGNELGERYCEHVDCWKRYRMMCYGAMHSYPEISGVLDPRDYLPDINQPPLYYSNGVPVYPARPPIVQQLINAGADAWSTYARQSTYQDIDLAIKALAEAASPSQINSTAYRDPGLGTSTL